MKLIDKVGFHRARRECTGAPEEQKSDDDRLNAGRNRENKQSRTLYRQRKQVRPFSPDCIGNSAGRYLEKHDGDRHCRGRYPDLYEAEPLLKLDKAQYRRKEPYDEPVERLV